MPRELDARRAGSRPPAASAAAIGPFMSAAPRPIEPAVARSLAGPRIRCDQVSGVAGRHDVEVTVPREARPALRRADRRHHARPALVGADRLRDRHRRRRGSRRRRRRPRPRCRRGSPTSAAISARAKREHLVGIDGIAAAATAVEAGVSRGLIYHGARWYPPPTSRPVPARGARGRIPSRVPRDRANASPPCSRRWSSEPEPSLVFTRPRGGDVAPRRRDLVPRRAAGSGRVARADGAARGARGDRPGPRRREVVGALPSVHTIVSGDPGRAVRRACWRRCRR